MMGKLPLGVVSPYVKMSSGGCADPLKFYATSYCTAYSREGFKPQVGQHKGAGYQSNYRPMINYQPSLDTLDNPAAREQIKDNAQSMFTQNYRPMELPDGRQPLPWSVYQPGSGYAREKTYSCLPSKEVKKVNFNTQDHGSQVFSGLEPKTVPVLHQSVGKGGCDVENYRYGPRFMTSEYASKYQYDAPAPPDFLHKKTIGAKEESGYTEQTTVNPIAFQPLPGDPGNEYLPMLAKGSERETAFSRLTEKVLPPTTSTGPPSLSEPSSMSHHRQYQDMPWMPQTTNALLGRETLGAKEPSGFSTHNPGYNRGLPDPDHRFLTTYNQRYFENIPKGLDREGWTRGGIQPQQPGGYGVNQPVTQHNFESYHNPTETLQRSHPHVGRTLTALDPFYRDTPHTQGFSALHATS